MHFSAPAFLASALLLGSALAGHHGYYHRQGPPPAGSWASDADASVASLAKQTESGFTTRNRLVDAAAPTESESLSLGLDDDGNPTEAWTPVVPGKSTKTSKTSTTKKVTTSSSASASASSSSTPVKTLTPTTKSSSKTAASQTTKSPTMGGPAGYGEYGPPKTSCKTGSTCKPTRKTVKSTITTPVEAVQITTIWKPTTITTNIVTTFLSTSYITVTSTTATPYIATKSVPYGLTTETVACETLTTTIPTFSLSECTETSTFDFTTATPSECTETSTVESTLVTSSPCPEMTTVTRQETSVVRVVSTGSTCSMTSSCKAVPTQQRPGRYGGW